MGGGGQPKHWDAEVRRGPVLCLLCVCIIVCGALGNIKFPSCFRFQTFRVGFPWCLVGNEGMNLGASLKKTARDSLYRVISNLPCLSHQQDDVKQKVGLGKPYGLIRQVRFAWDRGSQLKRRYFPTKLGQAVTLGHAWAETEH